MQHGKKLKKTIRLNRELAQIILGNITAQSLKISRKIRQAIFIKDCPSPGTVFYLPLLTDTPANRSKYSCNLNLIF